MRSNISTICFRPLSLSILAFCIASTLFGQQPSSHAATVPPSQAAAPNPASSSESPTGEHLNVLSVRSSNLHADPPILGERAVLPGFTREFIRLQWRQEDPVDIYVIRPIGVKQPPVIVYLYGFPTDIDKFRNDTFCDTVTRNGFAAVGFVSALTGLRYHDRPMKEWFVSELQESLAKSTHDVQMLLDYLDTRSDLDMKHLGMYGQGSGGSVAILSAVADSRIKAVDVMDPWGAWTDWLAQSPQIPEHERAEYLKPDFIAKVAGLDPVVWLPLLKDRPVRVQENTYNLAYPEATRKRVEAALPLNATAVQYNTPDEYVQKVSTKGNMLDWLRTQLMPSAASATQTSTSIQDAAAPAQLQIRQQ